MTRQELGYTAILRFDVDFQRGPLTGMMLEKESRIGERVRSDVHDRIPE